MKLKLRNCLVLSAFFVTLVQVFNSAVVFAEQVNTVVVPRSTVIPAVATMELSSQNLMQGQNVNVTVNNNFYYNNHLIVPLGSSINGTVTAVKPADDLGQDGSFSILFTNIVTPYGHVIPISGMIKTEDASGVVKGNVTKDNTDEIVKGAVKGSVAGAVIGGINNKNSIAIGSAVGSATTANSTIKGKSVIITVGSVVNVLLNQQSCFKPVQGYQY